MRFIVEESVTRNILTRDLKVLEPKVIVNLSGPCMIEFKIPYMEPSAKGINFRAWGQWIHVEEMVLGERKIICSGILEPTTVDEQGNLIVKAKGFSAYPDGLPWLENYNPVTVDPFHVVHRIWNYLQSQPNGNLGVVITPADSGTYMLPGFGFDGTELIIEFFAMFVRAADMRDCGDEMKKLARDIPFDFLEKSYWNSTKTQIDRELNMAYPKHGIRRNNLTFRLGDNVMDAEPVPESEIEWTSDVIVRGWFPGRVYSSQLANADPTRYRRVIKEEDAKINSRERAAVWAKRRLARRQVPKHWGKIVVDAHHINGPFGSWNLGDEIFVEGYMPWVGPVRAWHRIMSYALDGSGKVEMQLKHEGAFNYDPIDFPTP